MTDYRARIDEIDRELTALFARRMAVAAEIAAHKKEKGLPVQDLRREREKLLAVAEASPEAIREYTPRLYSLILELSRSYQNAVIGRDTALTSRIRAAVEQTPPLFPDRVSVACQGVEGANSQIACDRLFPSASILFFSDFGAVFTAVEKGLCRYGVIPVENSTAGSVNTVYDLMMRHEFSVVRSIRLKVEHNLLARPGVKLEEIREIYSHEQAIAQCSDFLRSLGGVRVIPCENTAAAAKMAAETPDRGVAALSSRLCMRYYNLDCLRESVQDKDNNYTRFIVISRDLEIYPGADRTSLMVTLPHEQGSLYRLLSRFNALGINLLKLESRPLPEREFEFMFYFDLDTPVYSPEFLQLMGELPEACESFHYLGSYREVL
ncbi:MAG: chorismate mutase [Oscillospiraceae bacterium]|nr:chorismate mutase [Oscillospiraceae bacterium]